MAPGAQKVTTIRKRNDRRAKKSDPGNAVHKFDMMIPTQDNGRATPMRSQISMLEPAIECTTLGTTIETIRQNRFRTHTYQPIHMAQDIRTSTMARIEQKFDACLHTG